MIVAKVLLRGYQLSDASRLIRRFYPDLLMKA